MHKLVYSVFKTIMVAMILVFAFDMASYLYRAMSLNQRMENIMVSMQRVVADNNGLTPDAYSMYKDMFIQLADDMNAGEPGSFVNGYWINYGRSANSQHPCLTTLSAMRDGTYKNILVQDMSATARYGDVMVVQVGVQINQPSWGFTSSTSKGGQYFQNDRTSSAIKARTHNLWFTYYVPCQRVETYN